MNNSVKKVELDSAARRLRARESRDRVATLLIGTASVLSFLLIWHFLVVLEIVDSEKLASAGEVARTIFNKFTDKAPDGNTLLVNIFASFKLALTGFVLALIFGFPLGLLMGWYKPIDKFVRPIFELIRPLPPIAWIPIVIVLLGIGTVAKSFIIFFTTFVPILINVYAGIKETRQVYIDYARACGYSNFRVFLTVGIPSAMPLSFAGMKVALGNGWSTLIAAEMLAANKGMGYMTLMGRNYGRIDIVIAGMLVIGLIGLLMTAVLGQIENRILKWRVRK